MVGILINFIEELRKYGLTPDSFEQLLQDCSNKVHKISDWDWTEICQKYNLNLSPDTIRKGTQPPVVGCIGILQMERVTKLQATWY